MSKKTAVAAVWHPDWSAGLRVWVERRGKAVLGEGRADLLSAIDRTHSISAAAREIGMSYRHAWLMVQAVNEAAGEAFVESAVGGVKGGGARLTDRGRTALALFRELTGEARRAVVGSLERIVRKATRDVRPLRLAAAISLQEAVGQVLTEFALFRPTSPVRTMFGASNELAEHILGGMPVDLFLTGDDDHVSRLEAAGLAKKKSSRVLAANTLAAVARRDAVVSVSRPSDLVRGKYKRLAAASPDCPLGKCTRAYFATLKFDDRASSKVLYLDNSRAVPAAVRGGKAEVGIVFAGDAAQQPDLQVLFRVRPAQASVQYVGVPLGDASEAADLLDFFTGEVARQCFRRCGLGVP